MTTFGKLRNLLEPSQRRSILGLLGLMIVGSVLDTMSIGFIVPALIVMTDANLAKDHPGLRPIMVSLGNPSQAQLVTMGMVAMVGLYLVKTCWLSMVAWKQSKYMFGVLVSMSHRLYVGYLRQPWTFHLQHNSAELIRNIISEAGNFALTGIGSGLQLATEFLVILGIAIMLFVIEPVGSSFVIGTLALAGWIFQRVTRRYVYSWGATRQYHDSFRLQHLIQGLSGAKDVKLLGREHGFFAEFSRHNSGSAAVAQYQNFLLQLPRLLLELLAVIGFALLVVVMLQLGRRLDTFIPILGLFAAAAFRLLPSVNRVLNGIQSVQFALPVINILYREVHQLEDTPVPERGTLIPFQRELALSNVSFQYPGADGLALSGISLSIPPGCSVGFVGSSGAGKSTLVDLILGLLTPSGGRIMVDGVDIQSNIRGWQDQIGYVPQMIYLTDDTLRRNVAFGLRDDEIDEEAVRRAIRSAQLEDFVASLSQGLETQVGERGVRLSGGQRQRIGIARALYHNPPVLVLDEATSSLDLATEQGVMDSVNALHGEKTVLIVAHRISTVSQCDRLYKLERGKVVREGSFESVTGALATGA